MQDLLKTPNKIPANVKEVLNQYNDCETYQECEMLKSELQEIGYTIDYDLSAMPFNLHKL